VLSWASVYVCVNSTLENLIRDAGRVPLERRTDYSPRHQHSHQAATPSKLEAIAEDQAEQQLGSFHKVHSLLTAAPSTHAAYSSDGDITCDWQHRSIFH
jgi:hypothetical protein